MNGINRHIVWVLAALVLALPALAEVTSEIYRIHSGHHVMIGGITRYWTNDVPNANQTFLVFTYDHAAATAEMRILGDDFQTEFQVFSNGSIVDGQVLFNDATFAGPVAHGTFVAVKQPVRLLSPRRGANGLVFSHELAEGLDCAIEYTDR